MELIVIFIISLFVTIKGADLLLSSSIALSRSFRIPETVIGATILSLVTTLPETSVALFSGLAGHSQLSFGNILGTPLTNLGLIGGITLLFTSSNHGLHEHLGKRRGIFLLALVSCLLLSTLFLKEFTFSFGVILSLVLIGYFLVTIKIAKSLNQIETTEKLKTSVHSLKILIAKFTIGTILLLLGTKLLTTSGIDLARRLSVSEEMIGLTFIAIGTSLPELFTAVTAIAKKETAIALGNFVGASFITLTLPFTIALYFNPIPIAKTHSFNIFLLSLLCIITLIFSFKPEIRKPAGFTLLAIYLIFILTLLL